jgi:Uma2 family endonuclease
VATSTPPGVDETTLPVPGSVKFPVELTPPDAFDPADLATWPRVEGSVEWVDRRLLYMPPCGDVQQRVVADVVVALGIWSRRTPGFVVATNEAGLILGEDVRGADAAVWRRDALPAPTGGLVTVPPLLAVEVEGRYESEGTLRDKAAWYLAHGTAVVWLVLPRARRVLVATSAGVSTFGPGDALPADARLPGLAPAVDELFAQIATT